MWVKWLAEGHIHFPYALTNHRHDVCVEENDLTTKQQTEDRANSKPRCEEIFFSMHKVQSFVRRECEVVQNAMLWQPACLPFQLIQLEQLLLVCTGSPWHDITVHHKIRMRSPLSQMTLCRFRTGDFCELSFNGLLVQQTVEINWHYMYMHNLI